MPAPYYIRLVFSLLLQRDQQESLADVISAFSQTLQSESMLSTLGINETCVMAVHVIALPLYTVSVLCLLVIYLRDKSRLTEHVIRISGDLKNIKPQKYVRLIGIHLALPSAIRLVQRA